MNEFSRGKAASKIDVSVIDIDGYADAIKAVADAARERDALLRQSSAPESSQATKDWADSEFQLRKNGNDVLNGLGAPLRALARLITRLDQVES
jgi:hypothetical protein